MIVNIIRRFMCYKPQYKPVRVQYASGLFVDLLNKPPSYYVRPVEPTLVLNGNISKVNSVQLRNFMIYCSRNWDNVLYVPGLYELSSEKSRLAAEQVLDNVFSNYYNTHLMANHSLYIRAEHTYFLGTSYICAADKTWLKTAISHIDKGCNRIVIISPGFSNI